MINKNPLEQVREALEFYANEYENTSEGVYEYKLPNGEWIQDEGRIAEQALATLNAYMERLESEGLVEEVTDALWEKRTRGLQHNNGVRVRAHFDKYSALREAAKAAIDAVNGGK